MSLMILFCNFIDFWRPSTRRMQFPCRSNSPIWAQKSWMSPIQGGSSRWHSAQKFALSLPICHRICAHWSERSLCHVETCRKTVSILHCIMNSYVIGIIIFISYLLSSWFSSSSWSSSSVSSTTSWHPYPCQQKHRLIKIMFNIDILTIIPSLSSSTSSSLWLSSLKGCCYISVPVTPGLRTLILANFTSLLPENLFAKAIVPTPSKESSLVSESFYWQC